jgi:hypothetical protein
METERMTDDLDILLGRLAGRPADPRLDAATASVLDRLAAAPAPRRDNILLAGALAALIAASIGVADGWSQRDDARLMAGFDTGRALAPSTLLGGG